MFALTTRLIFSFDFYDYVGEAGMNNFEGSSSSKPEVLEEAITSSKDQRRSLLNVNILGAKKRKIEKSMYREACSNNGRKVIIDRACKDVLSGEHPTLCKMSTCVI